MADPAMTDPTPNFAIIQVPEGSQPPAGAIATGPMSIITENVLGSRARAEAEALVKRAADAAEQEREREEREQELTANAIREIADGIKRLGQRIDAIEQSRDDRRKLDAASEATEEMLQLPKDAPDPEAPSDTLAPPAPTGELHPLAAKDPAEHEPVADQGNLPPELERGAPPDPGNYPELKDPPRSREPSQRSPVAFEE
jgi:hypothetical protein